MFVATVVLATLLAATYGNLYSVLGDGDPTPAIVSYCGQPDFFDRFKEQERYTHVSQCTDVQIAGYRVDVSVDGYHDGIRGCYTDYTVYNTTRLMSLSMNSW